MRMHRILTLVFCHVEYNECTSADVQPDWGMAQGRRGIYALTIGLKYKSATELVIFVVINHNSQTELIFTKDILK